MSTIDEARDLATRLGRGWDVYPATFPTAYRKSTGMLVTATPSGRYVARSIYDPDVSSVGATPGEALQNEYAARVPPKKED